MMPTIKKILIANRGEIAVRVCRTARQMGIATVAVYSEPDAESLHVESADESVSLGGQTALESYLSIDKILQACQMSGADAVHPGYGFLSENAEFAEACEQQGICFIGPGAAAIELMGSKRRSKQAMLDAGVPCIPGYQGADQDSKHLVAEAQQIGTPLMIKASAGGGGRGMRLVEDLSDIEQELDSARSEARNAFNNEELILERAISSARHIEVQVFADQHGNIIYLGERDCSVQRRHQKIIEESPSPFVSESLRQQMGEAAVAAAKACDYVGAGTVEFLVDQDESFYFLEMNTRLQVEHPVTELVTGFDLVEWQIQVAQGAPLPITQDQVALDGHAIEVRVYAEDPRQQFLPQTGQVIRWAPAHEVARIDAGIRDGQTVSAHYDPMLAKIIVHGRDRAEALLKLQRALDQSVLLGVDSNLAFLAALIQRADFVEAKVTTAFLPEQFPKQDFQSSDLDERTLAIAACLMFKVQCAQYSYPQVRWRHAAPLGKRIVIAHAVKEYALLVSCDNNLYRVENEDRVLELDLNDAANEAIIVGTNLRFRIHNEFAHDTLFLQTEQGHYAFRDQTYQPATKTSRDGSTDVRAAMDGAIVELSVQVGDQVQRGEVVALLEAMKMAHPLKAEVDGTVNQVHVQLNQQVKARQRIISLAGED